MSDNTVTAWRLAAGPDSVEQFIGARRATIGAWTADRSGKIARGDVVLIYGTQKLQCYAAIARVASAPVQNDRGQRLKKNRRWWMWLQILPLANPIPRGLVERQAFAQVAGCGLMRPQGASCHRVSPDAISGFAKLMRRHDEAAAARLDEWLAGRGRYPRGLDIEELREADWSPPPRVSPEERLLSMRIAERLNRQRGLRFLREGEAVFPRRGDDPARFSLEHPMQDHIGRGFADIVMVDERGSKRALIVIETKIRATLALAQNPLKVQGYADALKQDYGRSWAVRPVIVAEHFAASLLEEAKRQKIEHHEVDRRTGRLKPSL